MNLSLTAVDLVVADLCPLEAMYIDVLGMRENVQRSHALDFIYLESDKASLILAMR